MKPSRRKPAPWKPVFRRYIFNTLTAVSLLLLLATVGLWVRSYWRHDEVELWPRKRLVPGARPWANTGYDLTFIDLSNGSCQIESVCTDRKPEAVHWHHRSLDVASFNDGCNFHSNPRIKHIKDRFIFRFDTWWWMRFPLWAAVLPLLVLPILWSALQLRHRARIRSNVCLACGYDLTGNESGVCPECGAAIGTEIGQA